jgi:hypothetical protein
MASQGNDSYIDHLQKCYNQLRRSRLVKQSPVVNDDSLQHFARTLNSALPRVNNVEEELLNRCVKQQYYWNQRGFIRSLHPNIKSNNSRRDMRCLVLLTIGLEIVREFELDKVIHLNWNKDNMEYEAISLIDPANPPDVETFRREQIAARNARNMRRPRHRNNEQPATETPVETSVVETVTVTATSETPVDKNVNTSPKRKTWGDMVSGN